MEYELLPLTKEEAEYIDKMVDKYDDSFVLPYDGAPEDEEFALKIEDEAGNIIAGCTFGISSWGQMEINTLWVDEQYRGHGLGSRLLHEAERLAKEAGCYLALIGSFEFEAWKLYEKNGYTIYSATENWARGHIDYFLSKRLDRETTEYIPQTNNASKRFEIKRGNEEDMDFINDALGQFEDDVVPETHDYIRLNKKLVDKNGKMIAGVIAGINGWDSCYIGSLYVEEPFRNKGLGSYLLREIEREAKENGANATFTCLYDWQDAFIRKQGYTETGRLADHPKNHTFFAFEKVL